MNLLKFSSKFIKQADLSTNRFYSDAIGLTVTAPILLQENKNSKISFKTYSVSTCEHIEWIKNGMDGERFMANCS